MASARVLPFVRGIDFSHNNFKEENFPKEITKMSSLRWLKLNDCNIDWIPEEFATLNKLDSLSLAKNNLVTLHGELVALNSLRSLVFRHNTINNNGLPTELFNLEELSVLDLSHNCLNNVPSDLEKCKNLLVLNLSNNSIETIPNLLFINLTDLHFLDVSNNKLETLPPQMRRLVNLQVLNLSNNPLGHNQLRLLQSLSSLQNLNLSHTERTLQNMPTSLDNLTCLYELNISGNNLTRIPDVIYTFKSLKRLNLSDNLITELSSDIGDLWPNLEVLNVSRNKLKSLPQSLSKLEKLRRLYANHNELTFEGIPNSIGKLYNLEVCMFANNNLELIPESIVRCGKLRSLILSNNNLLTLPEAIYLLNDLKDLVLNNNPNLCLPTKPAELETSNKSIHNIDFTLANQIRKASTSQPIGFNKTSTPAKDSIARKLRLVRRSREKTNESDSSKVLKGMTDLAMDMQNIKLQINESEHLKPKKWEETLEKPPLDYSDFFEDDVGQFPGLLIWEIDNFLPSRLDDVMLGKFYEGDCYIILRTFENENDNLDWDIYYWIGAETSLDKKACAAIHAVNLRNYLSAHCRTMREEQNDESDEFLKLFNHKITYIEGGRTASGFYTVEEVAVSTRMYRLHELSKQQLYMESVLVSVWSLDSRFIYIIDTGYKIYVWYGRKTKITMKQKARLLVEKMNKVERKNQSELIYVQQSEETPAFWAEFNEDLDEIASCSFYVEDAINFKPYDPVLYQVCLGTGYLELPQVAYKPKELTKKAFETKNVYIMDVQTDVYIWIGKKSQRLVRAAALKLAQELFTMIKRPEFAIVTRCLEGVETESFKSRFATWDIIVPVDFTRTAESVQKIGANINKWLDQHSDSKYDLTALLMPRQPNTTYEEAMQIADEWNDDLESMIVFVLENKKFTKLPEEEFGHFFSHDCYVFLCRYWIPTETVSAGPDEEEETLFKAKCIVYFWQGRDASNMGWFTFTFSLQKKFESMFDEKLEVVRQYQQQENLKFLSHFKRKFVIHSGQRQYTLPISERLIKRDTLELFQLRSNCDPITLRCVENSRANVVLYSAYCYILKVPPGDERKGQVFLWIGDQADENDLKTGEEIAESMYPAENFDIILINEGHEPELFCEYITPLNIEKDCAFVNETRLFKCSNEKGYFSVSEKCSDFCQDDLADDDIMILDNGTQVFLWLGTRCSEAEIKLSLKSAKMYIQNLKEKQPDKPRTLMLTYKGKETRKFTKCFHCWSRYKTVEDPRLARDQQMLPVIYQHTEFYKKKQAKLAEDENNDQN